MVLSKETRDFLLGTQVGVEIEHFQKLSKYVFIVSWVKNSILEVFKASAGKSTLLTSDGVV